jgi:O-6-methylguanine DNA methyltransferase
MTATTISAVRTTGVFCRPGCPARPLPGNVERYGNVGAALAAGYRPCKRCFPLHEEGRPPRRGAPLVALAVIATPLGPMIGADWNGQLAMLEFADRRMLARQFLRLARLLECGFEVRGSALLARARRQVDEYFAGKRSSFNLPLATPGTEFQQRVWSELRRIPHGVTRSYADQAAAIGAPRGVRAVARANGDNRLAIVIPCHRIIGSDGSMTGYGGKVWRKRALLEREGAVAAG